MRRPMVVSLLFIVAVAATALGATVASGSSPQLGLDLQGGASVVLQPRESVPSEVLDQAIEIIRSRVDGLGVSEPEILRQGSSIIVQLPGVDNTDRAIEVVGRTAQLYFRPVLEVLPPETPTTTTVPGATTIPGETTVPGATTVPGTPTTGPPDAAPTTAAPTTAAPTTAAPTTAAPAATTAPGTPAAPEGATTTAPPPTTTVPADPNKTTPPEQNDPAATVVLPSKNSSERYRVGPSEVTGRALSSAAARLDDQSGQWEVQFNLTGEGRDQWNAMARKIGINGRVAIDLDGTVESAPVLQTTEFTDESRITGDFTEREAKDLALVLRYGSLPVQLDRQTVQTVSASLGRDSLRAGIAAGLVGLGMVAIYMVLYYRALGLVVWLGLALTGAIMYSLVSLLGNTSGLSLTLAGATGIIVSVGVTVDSYVVYFERLKDELRSGKSLRSSVDRGFTRAYRTILAADAASFIGAVVLYVLSVGSVRGFAFFLGLSTLLDVVVAYFFTRPMVVLLGRNRLFTEARWLGVARGLAASPANTAAS